MPETNLLPDAPSRPSPRLPYLTGRPESSPQRHPEPRKRPFLREPMFYATILVCLLGWAFWGFLPQIDRFLKRVLF